MFFSRDNMPKNLFNAKINLSGKQKAGIAITLLYALITFLLCSRHEMWGDELNVWMALKHYSFTDLINFSSKAGNPIFFFLPLFPFVKLGCSAIIIQFFCWFCSVLAILLLNLFSPFTLLTKTIITFSAPMLYHYSVMARCYSLFPPLMFLAAILYPYVNSPIEIPTKNNETKTWAMIVYAFAIAAIACTHIIGFIFAAGMTAVFLYENFFKHKNYSKNEAIAAGIMCSGITIVTIQTLYALLNNSVFEASHISVNSIIKAAAMYFSTMADAFSSELFNSLQANDFLVTYFTPIIIFLFITAIILIYRLNKMFALITIGSALFYIYISVTRYDHMFPYRTYFSILCIAVFLWILLSHKEKQKNKHAKENIVSETVLAIIFALTLPTGIMASASDWKANFSSAHETAMFIENNIPNDGKNLILGTAVPVAYYLKSHKLYYKYGIETKTILPGRGTNIDLEQFINKYNNIYVVISSTQKEMFREHFLVYESPSALTAQEAFCVIKINF